MPWEKDFDTEVALGDAMRLFWAKGYEATSMADLTKAMKINKGSLYNAFGNKKALFTQAILKYDRENRQAALEQLEAMESPLDSIQVLFDGLVAESIADEEKRGCFLVNTALELPNHTDDIGEMVTSALHDFESFFVRRVLSGQENGEISKELNAEDAAKSLLSQVVGLRVLARGVFSYDSLNAIKKQAILGLTS